MKSLENFFAELSEIWWTIFRVIEGKEKKHEDDEQKRCFDLTWEIHSNGFSDVLITLKEKSRFYFVGRKRNSLDLLAYFYYSVFVAGRVKAWSTPRLASPFKGPSHENFDEEEERTNEKVKKRQVQIFSYPFSFGNEKVGGREKRRPKCCSIFLWQLELGT